MADTPQNDPPKKRKVTIVTKKKPAPDAASEGPFTAPPEPEAGTRKQSADKGSLLDLQRLFDFPAGLADNVREVWMAGIGALSTVEEAGQAVFEELVRKGENWERESRQKLVGAKQQAETAADRARTAAQDITRKPGELAAGAEAQIQRMVEETVEGVLHRLGVPTHEEVRELIQRVESLSGKVDSLMVRLQDDAASPAEAPPVAPPAASLPGAAEVPPVAAPAPSSTSAVFHVVPRDGGWAVEREGKSRAASRHDTKANALAAGRELARSNAPSDLVVHRQDGTVQNQFSYEA